MAYALNDRVIDQYGRHGTIDRIYMNFWAIPTFTIEPREWLEMQVIPFTDHEIQQTWYRVLCDSGGSINSCESKLTPEKEVV